MDKSTGKVINTSLSLFTGGPLYQLYLWTGLARQPLLLCKRRIIFLCLIAWLPLLIITLLSGTTFSGSDLPFIRDIDTHIRFLVSLGLLIYAEAVANDRLSIVAQQF